MTLRLVKIKDAVEKSDPGSLIVPFSAAFELKVIEMDKDEKKAFEEENKATRSVTLIAAYFCYDLLCFA